VTDSAERPALAGVRRGSGAARRAGAAQSDCDSSQRHGGAALKLLRIIGSPYADQTTVSAIRALFDVTNAKRLEVTGADGEPLVPEMSDEDRLAAIQQVFASAKQRRATAEAEQ